MGWWTKKTKNWVKTLLALGNVQGNLLPGKQVKLNYSLDAFWCILTKPGSIQLYASGIWGLIRIMIKWHRGQWIQDMYIQSQNVRRLYVLPRPQSSQMTDRHTTTENQNKYGTFILKRQDNWNCISKDHIPHLLEEIVLGEQVGFGVLAAAVVGFQHLHGHAGQAWIIKSLNCTEYQAMQSAIRRQIQSQVISIPNKVNQGAAFQLEKTS